MLFFILLKILILREPINFVSNAISYYLQVIYILLRIHICLHVFASFLSYIQISYFDLNITAQSDLSQIIWHTCIFLAASGFLYFLPQFFSLCSLCLSFLLSCIYCLLISINLLLNKI